MLCRLCTRSSTSELSRVGRVTRSAWACMPHQQRKVTWSKTRSRSEVQHRFSSSERLTSRSRGSCTCGTSAEAGLRSFARSARARPRAQGGGAWCRRRSGAAAQHDGARRRPDHPPLARGGVRRERARSRTSPSRHSSARACRPGRTGALVLSWSAGLFRAGHGLTRSSGSIRHAGERRHKPLHKLKSSWR